MQRLEQLDTDWLTLIARPVLGLATTLAWLIAGVGILFLSSEGLAWLFAIGGYYEVRTAELSDDRLLAWLWSMWPKALPVALGLTMIGRMWDRHDARLLRRRVEDLERDVDEFLTKDPA